MFCPNCGTQNPDTAASCTKCGFNLKGGAAPKFKGTMLMMNQPPGGAGAPPAPAAPPPAAPKPNIKGTMVGMAPNMGPPPAAPPAAAPPPAAPPPAFGAPAAPPPVAPPPAAPQPPAQFGPPGGGPANQFAGTMVAPQGMGAFGAPPPGGPSAPPPGGGFGGPPPGGPSAPPPGGGFGGPPPGGPGGFGPPPGQPGLGGPPPGQPGFGAPPPGGPIGAPPAFGAMVPAAGAAAASGATGPKGEIMNPVTVTLLSVVTCGVYNLYWMFFKVLPQLKAYLGKSDEEINPMKELIMGMVCFVFSILLMMKLGKWIQEAQQRAGRANAEDKGTLFLIAALVFYPAAPFLIQTELNKIWDPSLQ